MRLAAGLLILLLDAPAFAAMAAPVLGWAGALGKLLPPLISAPVNEFSALTSALGHVQVELALNPQATPRLLKHLPSTVRMPPENFAVLKPQEQLAGLAVAMQLAGRALQREADPILERVAAGNATSADASHLRQLEAEGYYLSPEARGKLADGAKAAQAVQAEGALARARRWAASLGKPAEAGSDYAAPAPAAIASAELGVALDGVREAARGSGVPVGFSREGIAVMALDMAREAAREGRTDEVNNVVDWLLKPRAEERLAAAQQRGDLGGVRDAMEDMTQAALLKAGAKDVADLRVSILDLLPQEDRELRGSVATYVERALDAAAQRFVERGLNPLAFFAGVLMDEVQWKRAGWGELGDYMRARNEWTNFTANTYLLAAKRVAETGGVAAAKAILGPLAENRNYSIRIPDSHPLAKQYFVVSEWFAALAGGKSK